MRWARWIGNPEEPLDCIAFGGFSKSEQDFYYGKLECWECGAVAFFRRQTNNRTGPCFVSKYHQPGCSLAASITRHDEDDYDLSLYSLRPEAHIVIDPSYGAAPQSEFSAIPNVNYQAGSSWNGQERPLVKRLHPLFRALISSAEFRNSSCRVSFSELGIESTVKDVFVNIYDTQRLSVLSPEPIYGFWGRAQSVVQMDYEFWINFTYNILEGASFAVSYEQMAEILNQYGLGIDDYKSLVLKDVLIFGQLRKFSDFKGQAVRYRVAPSLPFFMATCQDL